MNWLLTLKQWWTANDLSHLLLRYGQNILTFSSSASVLLWNAVFTALCCLTCNKQHSQHHGWITVLFGTVHLSCMNSQQCFKPASFVSLGAFYGTVDFWGTSSKPVWGSCPQGNGREVKGVGKNKSRARVSLLWKHLAKVPSEELVPHLNPETSRGHTSAVLVAEVLQGHACNQFFKQTNNNKKKKPVLNPSCAVFSKTQQVM